MEKAVLLAQHARFISAPNPWVGCVIEENNRCLSEGFTQAPGKAHAESEALEKVQGMDLSRATLYVTLEPCCHYGKTPPCTENIIRSGIKTVVIGLIDPDPKVQGKGVLALQRAGITVRSGVLEHKISEQLEPYLIHRTQKIPSTVLKIAQSIDGRSAAVDGSSQWITGDEARHDSHNLRHLSQAILVGAGTILRDNPQLTVRYTPLKGPAPLRVVVDPLDKVPITAGIFQTARSTPTLCISSGTQERRDALANLGVETISCEQNPVPCAWIQQQLAERGVLQLLVEGGSMTIGRFFQERAFQKVVVYVGPIILGATGTPSFGALTIPTLDQAPRLILKETRRLGDSVALHYTVTSEDT